MDVRRLIWRLLGVALLAFGFFLAFSGILGLGNDAGPTEAILMFLGAAALVVLGWLVLDHAPPIARRSSRS
jgi:hypothetical protein